MKKQAAKKGYAMIMVICVMALLLVLSLSVLLAASTALTSAQNRLSAEQCRSLAISLSEEYEKQLTAPEYSFASEAAEKRVAGNFSGTAKPLWFYLKSSMTSGSWPYFNDDEQGHTAGYACRTFHINSATVPETAKNDWEKTGQTDMQIFWESNRDAVESGEYNATPLTVKVTCTANGQSCTITSVYILSVTDIPKVAIDRNGRPTTYHQWKWSLNWRE